MKAKTFECLDDWQGNYIVLVPSHLLQVSFERSDNSVGSFVGVVGSQNDSGQLMVGVFQVSCNGFMNMLLNGFKQMFRNE